MRRGRLGPRARRRRRRDGRRQRRRQRKRRDARRRRGRRWSAHARRKPRVVSTFRHEPRLPGHGGERERRPFVRRRRRVHDRPGRRRHAAYGLAPARAERANPHLGAAGDDDRAGSRLVAVAATRSRLHAQPEVRGMASLRRGSLHLGRGRPRRHHLRRGVGVGALLLSEGHLPRPDVVRRRIQQRWNAALGPPLLGRRRRDQRLHGRRSRADDPRGRGWKSVRRDRLQRHAALRRTSRRGRADGDEQLRGRVRHGARREDRGDAVARDLRQRERRHSRAESSRRRKAARSSSGRCKAR